MQGEINVLAVMDRAERLRAWQERQRRDAEWEALKQWWRAERRVRLAKTEVRRWQAKLDRAKTAWLYRHELRRAWPKWAKVQRDRDVRRSAPVVVTVQQRSDRPLDCPT